MSEEGGLVVLRTAHGEVRFDHRTQMWSLTDMHRAADGPPSKRPQTWLRASATQELIAALEGRVQAGVPGPIVVQRQRREGGIWAHWQVAAAYAATLKPAFYLEWSTWALIGGVGQGAASHVALTAATLTTLEERIAALETRLREPATTATFTYRRVPKPTGDQVDLSHFPKRPWMGVIQEVLRQIGRPLRPLEVTALLQEAGVPIDPLQVSRLLWKLTRDGRARRNEDGGYEVAAGDQDASDAEGDTIGSPHEQDRPLHCEEVTV